MKKAGKKVYYLHESRIIHLKGQSSKLRSYGVLKNFYDSALLYFKKNYKEEGYIQYFIMKIFILGMKNISIGYYYLNKSLLRKKAKACKN